MNTSTPFCKGLNVRIPIKIPVKGRGFINQGSTLGLIWVHTYICIYACVRMDTGNGRYYSGFRIFASMVCVGCTGCRVFLILWIRLVHLLPWSAYLAAAGTRI